MKRLLPKSQFARDVLTLMTGTTIAQAIPIAATPILTRIYTPEDFGVLALYLSVVSIATAISTGRYELSIMLPKKDDDAAHLAILSVSIAILLGLLFLLIVFFLGECICQLIGNSSLIKWLYFIPVSVVLTGLYQSICYWNNRKNNYKNLATGRIIQSGITSIVQLAYGLNKSGEKGLILGNMIGLCFVVFYIGKVTKPYKFKINRIKILALSKKYKKFPLFNSLNALVDSLRMSGIIFLISTLFTTYLVGQFTLAWRMVTVPISLLTSSISQPFYQKIATVSPSLAYTLTIRIIFQMAKISFFAYLFLFLYSPTVFRLAFGHEWEMAGEIVTALTPWLFISFITSPLAHIYSCYNKQNIMLFYSIAYMLIPLECLFLLRDQEFIKAISWTSFAMSLFLVLYAVDTILFLKKMVSNSEV